MALIVWDRKLETGHGKIDEQHQSLVEIVNRLHEAMKQGKGRGELEGILVFLKDYTVTHFAMEEELMDLHAYAGAPKHKQIHADLVRQVADLVGKFQARKASLTLEVMNFLEDWLVQHIQGEDYRFAQDLKGKGIR
ncbi:MAG: bacteriohemerythrin [Holophaga sp.]|jgi:hemerythrin-like metal-binding protein